jgi:hypothetical protein
MIGILLMSGNWASDFGAIFTHTTTIHQCVSGKVCVMHTHVVSIMAPTKRVFSPCLQQYSKPFHFSCPFCGAHNLDQQKLAQHCMENHRNDPNKVVSLLYYTLNYGHCPSLNYGHCPSLNYGHCPSLNMDTVLV